MVCPTRGAVVSCTITSTSGVYPFVGVYTPTHNSCQAHVRSSAVAQPQEVSKAARFFGRVYLHRESVTDFTPASTPIGALDGTGPWPRPLDDSARTRTRRAGDAGDCSEDRRHSHRDRQHGADRGPRRPLLGR